MDGLRRRSLRARSYRYSRKPSLILINGLAEQGETWFRNTRVLGRHFDVHAPNLICYASPVLHRRINEDLPISIDYLVARLHAYLEEYAQAKPYHLVASSMGGKVAVEYALRYPANVNRIVLICPSGMGDVERLPVVEGVRRNDINALIDSVFFNTKSADPRLIAYYRKQFLNRTWKLGLFRTIRGTMDHCVFDKLPDLRQPTLFITGSDDRIVDPRQAARAVLNVPQGRLFQLHNCGHAPQLEKPTITNRVIVKFLLEAQADDGPFSSTVLSSCASL